VRHHRPAPSGIPGCAAGGHELVHLGQRPQVLDHPVAEGGVEEHDERVIDVGPLVVRHAGLDRVVVRVGRGDHQGVAAQVERRLERGVQAHSAVEVPARPLRRVGDLDRGEHHGDGRRGPHV
jgi:hypothetical protein